MSLPTCGRWRYDALVGNGLPRDLALEAVDFAVGKDVRPNLLRHKHAFVGPTVLRGIHPCGQTVCDCAPLHLEARDRYPKDPRRVKWQSAISVQLTEVVFRLLDQGGRQVFELDSETGEYRGSPDTSPLKGRRLGSVECDLLVDLLTPRGQ